MKHLLLKIIQLFRRQLVGGHLVWLYSLMGGMYFPQFTRCIALSCDSIDRLPL